MIKPKLSESEAKLLIDSFKLSEKVIILGIRGYYKRTMGDPIKNDRGIYDDAICIITPDYYEAFNGNTDPSIFKRGISSLKLGIHLYRKGNHGISRGKGYPALRPATIGERLPVIRDYLGDSEGIAINIHKGGYRTTSSLGCQTIHPSQWNRFISKVYHWMDHYKQTIIPYVLIEV